MTPAQTMQDVWENLEITIPLDQVCSHLLRNLQSFDMPLFRLVQQFYINISNEKSLLRKQTCQTSSPKRFYQVKAQCMKTNV